MNHLVKVDLNQIIHVDLVMTWEGQEVWLFRKKFNNLKYVRFPEDVYHGCVEF